MTPLTIGSIGVGFLLIAFLLNVLKLMDENGVTYLIMNVLGASLSGYYALASDIIPFVILESVWAGAALVRLIVIHGIKRGSPHREEPA